MFSPNQPALYRPGQQGQQGIPRKQGKGGNGIVYEELELKQLLCRRLKARPRLCEMGEKGGSYTPGEDAGGYCGVCGS